MAQKLRRRHVTPARSSNYQGRGASVGRGLDLGITGRATVDPVLRNTPLPAIPAKA